MYEGKLGPKMGKQMMPETYKMCSLTRQLVVVQNRSKVKLRIIRCGWHV